MSPGSPKRGCWVSFTLSEDSLKGHAAAGPRSAAEEGVCVFRKSRQHPLPRNPGHVLYTMCLCHDKQQHSRKEKVVAVVTEILYTVMLAERQGSAGMLLPKTLPTLLPSVV